MINMMVSLAIVVGIAGSSLLGIYNANEEERTAALTASAIVDNAVKLQTLANLSDTTDVNQILITHNMPILNRIVKDGTYTRQELNALTKAHRANLEIFKKYPNLEDDDINCTRMVETKQISFAECTLVHKKKFKTFTIERSGVSYELEKDNACVQNYASQIHASIMRVPVIEPSFEDNETVYNNHLHSYSVKSSKNLEDEFQKVVKVTKEVDTLLDVGSYALASAMVKSLSSVSNNNEVVLSENKKIIEAIESTSEVVPDYELEMTKANIMESYNMVVGQESTVSSEAEDIVVEEIASNEVVTSFLNNSLDDISADKNQYVSSLREEDFTKHLKGRFH